MTQSMVTIEGLTELANDLIIQNTALRNRLDAAETQRDELLEALKYLYAVTETPPDKNCRCHIDPPCSDCIEYRGLREAINFARKAIAKAKGEVR